MIIWSGLGFFVPVIVFLFVLTYAMNLATNGLLGGRFYETHGWPKLAALLAAAISVWFLGSSLNSRGARTLVDKETGEEVILRNNHALFFLRMEHWAFILAAFGVAMLFDVDK